MKKKTIKRVSAIIILSFITFLVRPTYTPSINGNKSISELVDIKVGGQSQTLLIRGTNKDNPIVLFLHGGPGLAQICYGRNYQSKVRGELFSCKLGPERFWKGILFFYG